MIIRLSTLLSATIIILIIAKCARTQYTQLGLIAQWSEMEFAFPSADHRQVAIYQRKYVPGNAVPIDVDVDYSGRC